MSSGICLHFTLESDSIRDPVLAHFTKLSLWFADIRHCAREVFAGLVSDVDHADKFLTSDSGSICGDGTVECLHETSHRYRKIATIVIRLTLFIFK